MRLIKTLFLFGLPLIAAAALAQGAVSGTVYQTANVRSGPDTRFAIVAQLSAGDQVPINGQDAQGRWLRVALPSGQAGWLPAFALIVDGNLSDVPVIQGDASTPQAGESVKVIAYGRVNVRRGPGIGYGIVTQMDVSDQASAIARSNSENDWLLIRFGDTQGWVAYFTVNVQGDPRGLPVLVPDSSGQALIPPSRLLRTRFNVRLHTDPTLDAPVLLIVTFNSQVTVIGRSASGDWLYVGFNDVTGWGVTQLFDLSRDDLQALPVYGEEVPAPAATPASG